MAILVVVEEIVEGFIGFYDIGDLNPEPIRELLSKTRKSFEVRGHVVSATWFNVEPYEFHHLFPLPFDIDELDPYLTAPKELRQAILEGWRKQGHGLPNFSELERVMTQGKPDRFSFIDEWV